MALDRAQEVEATVATIRSEGGRAVALVKDSSNEKDVAGAVATAIKEFGGLDVCFANAGISGGLVPFFEETVEHWTEGGGRSLNSIESAMHLEADWFFSGAVIVG